MSPLTNDQKRLLLRLARQSLESFVLQQPSELAAQLSPRLQEPAAVFVSLHERGPEEALRGCIGFLDARQPLWKAVREAVRSAASRDPRFPSVRPEELPGLNLEISVLASSRPVEAHQIEIGVHGLIVSEGRLRGVLLPQVAEEHRWTAEQFLEQTCRKAGLPPHAWRRGAAVEAFTAEIFSED